MGFCDAVADDGHNLCGRGIAHPVDFIVIK